MISTELEVKALLGRRVTDNYGRSIGRIIAIDRNAFGEMEGVQVEAAAGQIVEAKATQLAVTPSTVKLTADWKVQVDLLVSELSLMRKRVLALGSLKDSKDIDLEIYEELLTAQRAGYADKLAIGRQLVELMKQRLRDVTGQVGSLTRHLATAKLDHKSGVLDEQSLRITEDSIQPTLAPLIAEKTDLTKSLRELEPVLADQHVSLSR
ncbi:MAG TPA: hypothetical protein VFE98_08785 [Candidatus Bathyarchaeia archaeon]|nr:hypothetical protein [Candidatus Bathyarchaeia archaeon]